MELKDGMDSESTRAEDEDSHSQITFPNVKEEDGKKKKREESGREEKREKKDRHKKA